jgi:hypothetical protein
LAAVRTTRHVAKSTAVNGTNASLTPAAPGWPSRSVAGSSRSVLDAGQPAVAVGARCSPGDRVRLYEWKAVVPRAATPRHDQQRLIGKRSSSGTRLRPIGSGCDDQRFRWSRLEWWLGGLEPPASSLSVKCRQPLCGPPFPQVAFDRSCRRYAFNRPTGIRSTIVASTGADRPTARADGMPPLRRPAERVCGWPICGPDRCRRGFRGPGSPAPAPRVSR